MLRRRGCERGARMPLKKRDELIDRRVPRAAIGDCDDRIRVATDGVIEGLQDSPPIIPWVLPITLIRPMFVAERDALSPAIILRQPLKKMIEIEIVYSSSLRV